MVAPDLKRFGSVVAQLRDGRGLSQQELADQVRTHRNTVQGWELGRSRPSDENLAALAEALHVKHTVLEQAMQPVTSSGEDSPDLVLAALELASRLEAEAVALRRAAANQEARADATQDASEIDPDEEGEGLGGGKPPAA